MNSDEEKRDLDEITAHLDRGWDLVQRGDLPRAEVSARRVLDLDAESPEAYTLLGAIAAGKGESDEALDLYARASELDPEFVDPLLYAAEVHLYPTGARPCNVEAALKLCDQALDLADDEDEYLDALLLKAEAQLAQGEVDQAAETLAELPAPDTDLPDATYHLRAGRLLLDVGELEAAAAQLERALARDPRLTDALHALGVVQEERGQLEQMVATFRKVREADLAEPPPSWGVPRHRFEELAEEALGELPGKIRGLLENVPIIADDYPAAELVAEGSDPRMMGFFSGVPHPDKSSVGELPQLDCIFLYHRNIERFARTTEEVEEEIRKTLLHETGHFFGLSEEELEAMGLG